MCGWWYPSSTFADDSLFFFQNDSCSLTKKKKQFYGIVQSQEKVSILSKSDGVQAKLQGWKAKLLYQASGTTLISSILQVMPLYTFFCFRVLETVCNKLDSITRAFWWGHEPGVRKLHLTNWDTIVNQKIWVDLDSKNSFLLIKQWFLSNIGESKAPPLPY